MKKFLAVVAVLLVAAVCFGVFDEEEPQQIYVPANTPTRNSIYDVPADAPGWSTSISNNIWSGGGSTQAETQIRCSTCRESGDCQNCGGEGRIYRNRESIDLGGGSVKYQVPEQCRLCEGTGDCYKCGGKGYRIV